MEYRFKVAPEDHGKRTVDVLVQRHRFSRLQAKKIRLYGELLVDGQARRMIDPLKSGEVVELSYRTAEELPKGQPVEACPDIPIYFQDEWVVLVGKPAGLLTHPSFSGETESLITRLSPYRLHPVTRLDRETSGLVLLAKSGLAHYALGGCELKKHYLAFVYGCFEPNEGLIDAPIARTPGSLIEREVHPLGKASRTAYHVLKDYGGLASMLRCELLSGRTHQIRVHCRHSGHALLGDSLYPPFPADKIALLKGENGALEKTSQEKAAREKQVRALERAAQALGRQALHAAELSFVHPFSAKKLHFEMPLPPELALLEQTLAVIGGAL